MEVDEDSENYFSDLRGFPIDESLLTCKKRVMVKEKAALLQASGSVVCIYKYLTKMCLL
jgi:hypothetical protein